MCEEGYLNRYRPYVRGLNRFCCFCGKKMKTMWEMEDFNGAEKVVAHKSCCNKIKKEYYQE
jgi:hypothetical protein